MKNRIFIFVVALVVAALFNINKLSAQLFTPSANNRGYINIDSYSNKEFNNIMQLFLGMNGKIEYDNWSLGVSAKHPISNDNENIEFPSIFSIRIRNIANAPSLEQNAIDKKFKPLQFENVDIIEKSVTPLIVDQYGYKQYIFDFDILVTDILVAGESYLATKINERKYYNLDLIFSVYGYKNGVKILNPLAVAEARIGVKNYPNNGNPPPGVIDFGFVVNADASLKFATPEDYTKQVESTENSSIKVTSKDKGYEIWVNSGDANFNGDSSAPPVNVVSMKVGDGTPITLSNTNAPGQLVYTGSATNKTAKELNVRYYITSEKSKELVKYGGNDYTTTLTYTFIPQ